MWNGACEAISQFIISDCIQLLVPFYITKDDLPSMPSSIDLDALSVYRFFHGLPLTTNNYQQALNPREVARPVCCWEKGGSKLYS